MDHILYMLYYCGYLGETNIAAVRATVSSFDLLRGTHRSLACFLFLMVLPAEQRSKRFAMWKTS